MSCTLAVASAWDSEQIDRWVASGTAARRVGSVFGSRQRQLLGHGRAPADVPAVSDEQIVSHCRRVRARGVEFHYLLNGLSQHLDLADSATLRGIDAELAWVVEEVQPSALVIADLRIAKRVHARYRERAPIKISTIAGIKSPGDLTAWLDLSPRTVVLHHDANREFAALEEFTRWLLRHAPDLAPELLVNEACVHGCLARHSHYARLSAASLDYEEGFQQGCNAPRLQSPAEVLASNWIRPEDLCHYQAIGIHHFKVAGREMPPWWLDRAVRSYLVGRHVGNLVELLTMTPPGIDQRASDVLFIDNESLDGWLEVAMDRAPRRADAPLLYEELAVSLWREERLRISDVGSAYSVKDGRLECQSPGQVLTRLRTLAHAADPTIVRLGGNPHGRSMSPSSRATGGLG